MGGITMASTRFFRIATLLIAGAVSAFGQSATATIVGRVVDASGASVSGASVTAINTDTNERRNAPSDPDGSYIFPALAVGNYRVEAQLAGFKNFARTGITLEVNRNARVDIQLEVGAVTETVEVTGDAPVVDTFQVQMGALVDQRRVENLPLSGRNIYSLVSTLAGVRSVASEEVSTRNGNLVRANGSRLTHTSFTLDGGFNNSHWRNGGQASPNPDAVQEFNVITNNFNAEYGRSSGSVVSVVTKSGTNEFHGGLYEFLRNDKLNAKNFFESTVAPLRQHQFGGMLGGPVIRNKTFFFGSHERFRIRSSEFRNTAVPPTAAERLGDFSAAAAAQRPLDPTNNRQPFPNGLIPVSRFDPVARTVINRYIGLPNSGRFLETRQPRTSDQNQYVAKGDHLLNSQHKIFGTFFYLHNDEFAPFGNQAASNIPEYTVYTPSYYQYNAIVNHNWIPSPTFLNELRFTYTRNFYDDPAFNNYTWSDWGSRIPLAADFHKPYPPSFNVTGRFNIGKGNDHHGQRDDSFVFSENATHTRGRHNLKYGTFYAYERYNSKLSLTGAGALASTGSITANPLADFMLGRGATFRQTSGTLRAMRRFDWESFIQDDWKIHPKLTLNLGVRYELVPRFWSSRKDLQTFRPGVQSTLIPKAPVGMAFEGDPGVPRSMAPLDKNNLAPRVGVAYDVFGNGRTAIRAGFGIFYSHPHADSATFIQNQPFQHDLTIFGIDNLIDPYASSPFGRNPFPPTSKEINEPLRVDFANPFFLYPLLGSWMDAEMTTPYAQQYSFAIEHQVLNDLSVQAAYVGNTGRKLQVMYDVNAPAFRPGASTVNNVNDRRPIQPGIIGQLSKIDTASNSNYNSLQLSIERRFRQGFSITANYTWSKAIDEISDDPGSPVSYALADQRSRAYNRSASDIDLRHIFNITYVWELPTVRRWSWLGSHVLSGWQLNGLARITSGDALNILAGVDTNLDGITTNDRPNVIGNARLSADRSRQDKIARYFDTAAFQPVVTGALGTVGRNIMYGPGTINWDGSAFKNIRVTERHQLQFRAEFFNALNKVNLRNPVNALNSTTFGQIRTAGAPRVVQFALKYNF
jgi:Carboxypeptidase regulatory-like domain